MDINRISRGEVWYHSPEYTTQGHIQGGPRPVIVVSNDMANRFSPVLLVIPCTTKSKKNLPTHVLFTIDGVYNTALAEQACPVLREDLLNLKYVLDDYLMDQVDLALGIAFGLQPIPGREENINVIIQDEEIDTEAEE